MTLRHLEIFAEVCHMESITLAAERLHMAQPAVSTVIRDLESYYGVRLFDRMNRRIYITQAGTMLYNYAISILSQLDDVKELLNEGNATGTLRIGSNIAFAKAYLSKMIHPFTKRYPNLYIYSRVQNPSHLEKSLLNNELDFAIADKSTFSNLFCYEHLTKDHVGLVCSSRFAERFFFEQYEPGDTSIETNLETLAELPFLLREIGSGSRDNIDQFFKDSGLAPNIIAESISPQVLIRMCQEGLGITTAPDSQILNFKKTGEFVELIIPGCEISRNYYLIYHKNKYFTYGMQLFLDYLRNQFPNRILR